MAFFTQSGALGVAVIDEAGRLGIGLSGFVSAGNKIDISGNDLLQYWEQDSRTDVILLYLESFGNPRRFAEIARRVSRRKPIIAVKGGRSSAGARAAASHTAALRLPRRLRGCPLPPGGGDPGGLAGAALRRGQGGGHVAAAGRQPGRRGGQRGGAGILTADACEAAGLALPELGEKTTARLREVLNAAAAIGNPIDMTAMGGPEEYRAALEAVLADPAVDSVITIFTPLHTDAVGIAGH